MKIKIMILAVILMTAFGVHAKDVTVGLFYGSTAKSEITLSSVDGLRTGETVLGETVTAKIEGGVINIYDATGENILASGEELFITSEGDLMKIGEKKYRGGAVIRKNGEAFDVINKVDIEEYLYGVVSKEMSPSWNTEALKAQAIVARTMVFSSLKDKHSDLGFELCATTNCQVYGGYEAEHENTNRAVNETAGLIVKYNGEAAKTFYSAGNGGYTERAENVWGGSIPYLVTMKDSYEKTDEISSLTWTLEVTPSEIAEGIKKYGGDVGQVTNMRIKEASESGRIIELEVTGTDGSFILTKEKTRTFLGLRSQLYTISGGTSEIYALDGEGKKQTAGNKVIGGDGKITEQKSSYVIDMEGISPIVSGSDSFTLTGRGYGHGIGMSQWGAKAMGDEGKTAAEILGFYFPGTNVESYE